MAASTRAGKRNRSIATAVFFGLAVVFTLVLAALASHNHPFWVFVVAAIDSPGLVIFVAWFAEGTPVSRSYNLKVGSWAFLVGDWGLAAVLAFLTAARHHTAHLPAWSSKPWWLLACFGLGLAVAYAFRNVIDKGSWAVQNTLDRRDAPSKLDHDWCVYPSLVALLIYLAMPLVLSHGWHSVWFILAVIAAVVWMAGVAHDSAGLDTWQLHALYNYDAMEPAAAAGVKLDSELTKQEVKAAKSA